MTLPQLDGGAAGGVFLQAMVGPQRSPRRSRLPATRATSATILNIRLTPTLMLGANNQVGPGGQGVNLGDLGRGKAGGPQDHGFARVGHGPEMRQGRLGMGELDDHLSLGQDLVQGVHHF